MEYVQLGNTNIKVSRLCFGSLIISPLQRNLPPSRGAEIIRFGVEQGINFIDTAELYDNYEAIRLAQKGINTDLVIATKTYAYDRKGALASLEKARKALDRDVIDLFMLHEQESRLTLRGHREALETLYEARDKGLIRAVGVSTHFIEVVEAVSEMPSIDVVHPLINKAGLGIQDGNVQQMLNAIQKAYDAGKGVYGMKPLGGGNLLHSFRECMDFVLGLKCLHSIAIGMQSEKEILCNVALINGEEPDKELLDQLGRNGKHLHIDFWCEKCGRCVKRCKNGALTLDKDTGIHVDESKCLLCGYCSSACPAFAIKIC